MDLVTLKVPAKITLFGEHTVVYGTPAIASTIPIHITIAGRMADDDFIKLEIKQGLQFKINTITVYKDEIKGEIDQENAKRFTGYAVTAINLCEKFLGISEKSRGYIITIDSPLPVGVGLGTSAAISVGITTLCLTLNNYIKMDELENYRQEIAKLAWSVEKLVQGSASPMDTYTISLGGLRYIIPSIPISYPVDLSYELPIIIGYTHREGTTAELIRRVRRVRELHEEIFSEILRTVSLVVDKARKALLDNDLETLGTLMNINHGMLQALGIVDMKHAMLAHILKVAGALGVKTSGAGGGGAFIALAPSKTIQEKLISIAEALGATIVSKSLCKDGVRFVH